MLPLLSAQQVSSHKTAEDLWTVVDGTVYDLTDFAPEHPGGLDILLRYAGRDATAAYTAVHSLSLIKTTIPLSKHMGPLNPSTVPTSWADSTPVPASASTAARGRPNSQAKLDHNAKPPLNTLISAHDFAAAARATFPPKTRAFVTSAATDLHTYRRNSEAYSLIGLRPRILQDVRSVSISTTMLGHPLRTPIFLSPTSLGKTVHPEGEKELGRACSVLGTAQVVSTSASFPLEEIISAIRSRRPPTAGGDEPPVPVFFQLYVDKNRAKSEALLRGASQLGISGLFLTVDAPVPGKREADERLAADAGGAVSSPMTGAAARGDAKGGALGRVMGGYIDAGVTWRDVDWLRAHLAPGTPIVLKGVQTAADARLAAAAGVDAIVVSNHGGRSLDTAPATILVLLELQRCCPEVFDRMEVFVDGGIMRGTDVFKALCLGAKAVGIGRGALYGLNYGEDGVKRYVESELLPEGPGLPTVCWDLLPSFANRLSCE